MEEPKLGCMCHMPLKHQENVTALAPLFPTQPPPPHHLPPPRLGCASEFLAGTLVDSCCYSLFCCSVMSDSLQPHGLQDARLPCPSLSPRVCSNSCPFSWLCHTTISSSVVPFSSCPQSFSASGFFPMSWFFTSSGIQYQSFQ